jgi:hypothetical protein
VEYVLGRRRSGDDRAFHAWLLVDGLTIDITADQFDDIAEPVIVTTTSPWHGRVFEIEDDDLPGDYRDYDDHTVLRLNGLYAILMRNLRFSHGASPS